MPKLNSVREWVSLSLQWQCHRFYNSKLWDSNVKLSVVLTLVKIEGFNSNPDRHWIPDDCHRAWQTTLFLKQQPIEVFQIMSSSEISYIVHQNIFKWQLQKKKLFSSEITRSCHWYLTGLGRDREHVISRQKCSFIDIFIVYRYHWYCYPLAFFICCYYSF